MAHNTPKSPSFAQRMHALMSHVFKDRQILIRSQGNVRCLNFSKFSQMGVASVGAIVLGFGIWSVVTILVQDLRIEERNQAIAKTNLAYSAVVEEMTAAQHRFVALVSQMQKDQSHVVALLEERNQIQHTLSQIDQNASDASTDMSDHANLFHRLADIDAELLVSYDKKVNQARLASLQKLAHFSGSSPDGAERSMETTLPTQANQLGDTSIIRRYLRAAEIKLNSAIEERDTARAQGEKLSDKVNVAERRIAALLAAQKEFVEQLTNQTNVQIASLESSIAETGLNTTELLERHLSTNMGQGGPANLLQTAAFEAVDGVELDKTTQSHIAFLERRLNHWTALHAVTQAMPLSSPVDYYYISSRFGKRRDPFNGRWAMHEGLDMAGSLKTPIMASAPGVVTFAGRNGAYGKLVEIDHGNGIRTRYGHLHTIGVKKGDTVGHRDQIGRMGSTGRSTGSHLHYEVYFDGKALDPAPFIQAGRNLLRG